MSDSSNTILIGVDGGGTRCRAAIGTVSAGILARAEGGRANVMADFDDAIANIATVVQSVAALAGVSNDALSGAVAHVGLAGLLSNVDGDRVRAALPFAKTDVTDDRVTAVSGSLSSQDGFLVSAGTGSFLAAQKSGSIEFIGGWGFHIGDQASGAWLGRKALELVLLSHDGIVPHSALTRELLAKFQNDPIAISTFSFSASPRDFGAYAPAVIAAAQSNDSHAISLMAQGASYIQSGLEALEFVPGDPICILGGVGAHYESYIADGLLTGRREPDGTALDGAFLLAKRAAAHAAECDA